MYHVWANKVCKYIFDRQVGQPIVMFGPNILIGRTFYGPMPSTDDINTYKWVCEETFIQHNKKCFWTKSPTLPLTNLHSRSLLKLKQSSVGWRGRRSFWALIYRPERRSSRTPSTCSVHRGPQTAEEASRCTSTSTWTKKPGPGFSDRTRALSAKRRTKTCSAGSPWRTHTVTSAWRKTTAAPVTPMTSRGARASSTGPAGSRLWAVCDDNKFNSLVFLFFLFYIYIYIYIYIFIIFNRTFYTIKDITFPFSPMITLTAKIIKQTK